MSANSSEAFKALLEGHESLLVEVAIVLNFTESHVGGSALDNEVELVRPHVVGHSAHEDVRPASVLNSMEKTVVFDGGEALLQHCRVEKGVQGVTGDIQGVDLSGNDTRVLLGRQVLY